MASAIAVVATKSYTECKEQHLLQTTPLSVEGGWESSNQSGRKSMSSVSSRVKGHSSGKVLIESPVSLAAPFMALL